MTLDAFQEFIDEQDTLLRPLGNTTKDKQTQIFKSTIKLGEEYGELCDEILASVGHQRKDKLSQGEHDLAGEFADVVIVAFILAKQMGINMERALSAKAKKIREKHNKQLE
jgi:NTP pyrophosphatase (non-canonical NTP hydrolase)